MKMSPLRYGLLFGLALTLIVTALLSLVWGAGYVLVVWLGWQIQTSAAFFIILLVILATILAYLLVWIRQFRARRQLKQQQCPGHVNNFHWFEQLGCLWLLEARQSNPEHIQSIFDHSSLLRPLIQARLAREYGQFEQAAQALQHVAPVMQDLAALANIELLIAEQQGYQAVSALNQLVQKPKSEFIQSLEPAYQSHIDQLWAELAKIVPWVMVSHGQSDTLLIQKDILKSLREHVEQSTPTQQQQVLSFFDSQMAGQSINDLTLAKKWLALLNVMPETAIRRMALLEKMLHEQFEPNLFYQWLLVQLEQERMREPQVQQYIEDMAARYPAQSVIDLAKWHMLTINGQQDDANVLLANWPQDRHFSYLRVRQALLEKPALLADLDLIHQVRG